VGARARLRSVGRPDRRDDAAPAAGHAGHDRRHLPRDDRRAGAILAEFSVGSPDWSEAFAASGIRSSGFTLLLIFVDASPWPRLTVHPSRFNDHDWARRLLGADHRVHTLSERMDERYRVVASARIGADRLGRLFTPELIEWWLAQESEVLVDVEDHGDGAGFLTVAQLGIGIGDEALTTLQGQASHLLAAFAAVT
jgi:hypothetical protein